MYMMIAATLFAEYPTKTRMSYVKKYYDAISLHKINIPTPVMAGVRTPIRQFASCVLVDSDDTLPSIFSSDMAIGLYVARRAGIGINAGRIRGINSKIRGGEVQHTGVIPFLKKFESTVRCCTQNGVRGGNATCTLPNMASGDRRHPCAEEQQRHRGQQSEDVWITQYRLQKCSMRDS